MCPAPRKYLEENKADLEKLHTIIDLVSNFSHVGNMICGDTTLCYICSVWHKATNGALLAEGCKYCYQGLWWRGNMQRKW